MKNIFNLSVFLFVNIFSAHAAENDSNLNVPEFFYTFSNMNELILSENNIEFGNAKEKFATTLSTTGISAFLENIDDKAFAKQKLILKSGFKTHGSFTPTFIQQTNSQSRLTFLQFQSHLIIMNQEGNFIYLPYHYDFVSEDAPTTFSFPPASIEEKAYAPENLFKPLWIRHFFIEYSGRSYLLLQLPAKIERDTEKNPITVYGPVYLIRDDLEVTKVAQRAPKRFKLDTNIDKPSCDLVFKKDSATDPETSLGKIDALHLTGAPHKIKSEIFNTNEHTFSDTAPVLPDSAPSIAHIKKSNSAQHSADLTSPPSNTTETHFTLVNPTVLNHEGKPSKALTVLEHAIRFWDEDYLKSAFPIMREKDARAIDIALSSKETGSIVLTGEGGIGKTSLLKTFAKTRNRKNQIFIQISASSFGAGGKYVNSESTLAQAMIQLSRANPGKIVWVIDEIHSLRGQGTYEGNSNDVFTHFRTPLGDNELQFAGTSNKPNYNRAFGGDAPLKRRLPSYTVDNLTLEETLERLESWLSLHKLPAIDKDKLAWVVELSEKLDGVGGQPDKAKRFIDRTYTEMDIDGKKNVPASREDFIRIAPMFYSVPAYEVRVDLVDTQLEKLRKELDVNFYGLDHVKKFILQSTEHAILGLGATTGPRLKAGLFGFKGLAKTSFVKTYAEIMNLPFKKIDLSAFNGLPPEELSTTIASALKDNSFTIFLFDELETAHPKLQKALLTFLGSNEITARDSMDGSNGPKTETLVRTNNAMAFFAGNAGESYLKTILESKQPVGFNQSLTNDSSKKANLYSQIIVKDFKDSIAKDQVDDKLLDRLEDGVLALVPAQTINEFEHVVSTMIQKNLKEREHSMNLKNLSVQNLDELTNYIATKHYSQFASYREPKRELEVIIANALVKLKREINTSGVTSGCESFLVSIPAK